MENFDGNQRNVREKSVYLLHLDTPRIILIASVIIGIIAASFLFGMNFIKKGDGDSIRNELISSANKPVLPFDSGMPMDTENEPGGIHPDKSPMADISDNKSEPDLLTADNIKEIIPPFKEEKSISIPKERETAVSKKTASVTPANINKPVKKTKNKKEPSKKQKVVEVVSTKPSHQSHKGSGYAIQVAAFDTKVKADSEVRSLKDMKYDAFMEKSIVSGKIYYRVKIGPMSSKGRALDLLHELQEQTKYRTSYVTSN